MVVKRIALEYYYLGKWMTPEFPLLIATAPDTDALRLDASEHYQHWAQNFADESGYLGDPNHVDMKVEFCHQVGMNYVSCSPFRVLTARLAAAQAAASDQMKGEAGRTK